MKIPNYAMYTSLCGVALCSALACNSNDDGGTPEGDAAPAGTCGSSEPVYVAFRMDDLQDWFAAAQAKVVNDKFIAAEIPLTIGIITNVFGQQELSKQIAIDQLAAGGEIANHTGNHEVYGGSSESTIYLQVSVAQAYLAGAPLNVEAATYIVPHYQYLDATTMPAMKDTSEVPSMSALKIVSGRCAWSHDGTTITHPGPYCLADDEVSVTTGLTQDGIGRLPAGAVLGCEKEYFDSWGTVTDDTCALAWMNAQIENQGFGILVLHPNEFSEQFGSAAHYKVLDDVIAYAQDNWCPLTMTELLAKFPNP